MILLIFLNFVMHHPAPVGAEKSVTKGVEVQGCLYTLEGFG